MLNASEPLDDSLIEEAVIIGDGNRDSFVLEETFIPSNFPVLENELIDNNKNVDDSIGEKTVLFEKKNVNDSPSTREHFSLLTSTKPAKIVKAVSVERTNQYLMRIPREEKEFPVTMKKVLVEKDDKAYGISVHSGLPSVSSLEKGCCRDERGRYRKKIRVCR